MTPMEIRDSGFFSGRLDRIVNKENSPVLKEIRNEALAAFSSLPFLESGEVKFNGDLKEMAVSQFNESYQPFIEGYAPANKLYGVGAMKDFSRSLDSELLLPRTGFGAYCLAFFEKGLYVECGNSGEKGFILIDSGPGLSLEPVYIKVPAGISATLFLSLNNASDGLALNHIRAAVGEGAFLKLFVHAGGEHGSRFVDLSAALEKESKAEIFVLRQEGQDFVYRSNLDMKGENAQFIESSLASLKGKERVDLRTAVVEDAAGSEAHIEVRAIVRDSSRVGLNGLIKVNKAAVKSRSRYSGHCLKLSSSSRADVQPNLEIEALDIEASHAASVSPLDGEKLFYLEARGLSPGEAEKEISLGFLSALLKENAEIAAIVEKYI